MSQANTTSALVPTSEAPLAVVETAASAVAAQARAAVEARYVMAERNPRDWDTVRIKLLKDCSRPGFAAVARYRKPVGKKFIEGPSARFAEAAARHMGNICVEPLTIFDDSKRRITRIVATDLESNLTYQTDVVIEKTIERHNPADRVIIRQRTNTRNETVYIVEATEEEIANKVASGASKANRQNILKILPGDILDECMEKCIATLHDESAKDPDAARRKLADAFAAIGVTPDKIKEYLGHDLDSVSPAELTDLRDIYNAIKEGETTWRAVMDEQGGAEKKESNTAPSPKGSDAVKSKVRERIKVTIEPPASANENGPPPIELEAGAEG